MSAGAGNPAVESLAAAAFAFLRCHPPFDEMEDEPLHSARRAPASRRRGG